MQNLQERQQEGVVISVDYKKCFDRIKWGSIFGAMKVFNFGSKIISWIKTLYEGATIQISNNGHLSPL